MPSVLPLGDPAPSDGLLPGQARTGAEHVPSGCTCTSRSAPSAAATATSTPTRPPSWAAARRRTPTPAPPCRKWTSPPRPDGTPGLPDRPLSTVFFGGGTPTLLPAEDLARILAAAIARVGPGARRRGHHRSQPGLRHAGVPAVLADAGFTRVSFGMQSAVPHVLKVLDRTHTPSRVPQVVQWAREAGLAVSLDLIYGTPGESLEDWRYSLETALSYEPGPHQRLCADRGGRHQARRPDPPRRSPGNRRRRPRRQVRTRRPADRRSRARLV